MLPLADDTILDGVQEYWLIRDGGGPVFANVLEALPDSLARRWPSDLRILAGPHQGSVIRPDQSRRVAVALAARGVGIERRFAEAALRQSPPI